MLKKLMTATLLVATTYTYAEKLYRIDFLVFTQINRTSIQSEIWPDRLLIPNSNNTITLISSENTCKNYQLIEPRFNKEAELLTQNKSYKIILNQSWYQTVNLPKNTKWIHIFGGQSYNSNGQINNNDSEENDSISINKPTYWKLNGKLKISKSKHYNIQSKLYLTLPENVFINNYTSLVNSDYLKLIPLRTITLFSNIRTHLNKLNYLDNPLFGVLIKISEVKNVTMNCAISQYVTN